MGVKSKITVCFLCCALILCAFSSCRKKTEKILETQTALSNEIEIAQESTAWAYEIEGDRLTKKIASIGSMAKDIPTTPQALVALEGGKLLKGIFPELEGFTSLDTTNIQGEIFDTINGFCAALVEYTKPVPKNDEAPQEKDSSKIDGFFYPESLFSLVLFLADTSEYGAIKSYVIGQPFINEEIIEVPVRFACTNKKIYAMIYPVLQRSVYKIHQIEIYKEE